MSNGQSIVIKGDISGGEDLLIAGRVEGRIALDGCVLTLAAGSQVVGTISAASVIVSGNVDGGIAGRTAIGGPRDRRGQRRPQHPEAAGRRRRSPDGHGRYARSRLMS